MTASTDTRPVAAPLDLCRSASFVRTGDTGDGLTLEGYAAVFDQRTVIDSWEGSFVETIKRGAFRKTIRERTPVMQFDHGRHALIGSIPIGKISELREDEKGLFVSARLVDNWLIAPLRDAIGNESIDGMSFRFEVIRDEWHDNAGKLIKPTELADLLWNSGERGPITRTLLEVRCAELGPVVFPAYDGTSVSVRAADMALDILDDEQLRRDVLRSLASGEAASGVTDDQELRREIARAVLFGAESAEEDEHREGTPPDAGHLPERESDEEDEQQTADAPPDAGHPSLTPQQQRAKYARAAYVTREGVGKRYQ
jgi:HK97 family phage prohead protease